MRILRPFARFTVKILLAPEEAQILPSTLSPRSKLTVGHQARTPQMIFTYMIEKQPRMCSAEWWRAFGPRGHQVPPLQHAFKTVTQEANGRGTVFEQYAAYRNALQEIQALMEECYISAAGCGNVDVVKLISPLVVDVPRLPRKALHHAATGGHIGAMKHIIQSCDIQKAGYPFGWICNAAATGQQLPALRLLRRHRLLYGRTADVALWALLDSLVQSPKSKRDDEKIRKVAQYLIKNAKLSTTSMLAAVQYGDLAIIKMLKKRTAQFTTIPLVRRHWVTALLTSIDKNNIDVMNYLLGFIKHNIPLLSELVNRAANTNRPKIMKLLYDRGAPMPPKSDHYSKRVNALITQWENDWVSPTWH